MMLGCFWLVLHATLLFRAWFGSFPPSKTSSSRCSPALTKISTRRRRSITSATSYRFPTFDWVFHQKSGYYNRLFVMNGNAAYDSSSHGGRWLVTLQPVLTLDGEIPDARSMVLQILYCEVQFWVKGLRVAEIIALSSPSLPCDLVQHS